VHIPCKPKIPLNPPFWPSHTNVNRPARCPYGGLVSTVETNSSAPQAPVPPAGEKEMRSISGSGVIDPSGSPEGRALWRCPRRTPLRRGAPAGEKEMRSISGSGVIDPSGSPEGRALWRCPRRTPLRRGAPAAQASTIRRILHCKTPPPGVRFRLP